MFVNGRKAKRKLITVNPQQRAALELYAKHYEVLGALMTLTQREITEALARGYETETEVNGNE